MNSAGRIISFAAARYKNKPFIVDVSDGRKFTFREWKERVDKIILFLKEINLKKDNVCAFISPNGLEYFEIRAACHYSRIVFFGLPANLLLEDIIYFLNKSGAKVLFFLNPVLTGFGKTGKEGFLDELKTKTRIKHFIELDSPAYTRIFDNKNKPDFKSIEAQRHSAVLTLNLSSATTKRIPKIIQLTELNWLESLYNFINSPRTKVNNELIFLCCLPFVTAGSTVFLPLLMSGAVNIIIKEDIPTGELVDCINKYRVNQLYLTPSRLLELLDWCKENNEHLDSLESIITGGEKIPALKLKEAIGFFGPKISVGYGMVEALPPITILSPLDYRKDPNLIYSAGRAIDGAKIKILSDARIAIKSKTVSRGYLDDSQGFENGWFYTNDFGRIDKNGFLYILGRREEILAERPRRIFAAEIEDRLYELSFIQRCAVTVKDSRVFVFVSLRENMDKEVAKKRIIEFCRGNLADILIPDEIIIKNSLPLNYSGKLDRMGL